MASGKWRPYCLGLNVLTRIEHHRDTHATMLSTSFMITSLELKFTPVPV